MTYYVVTRGEYEDYEIVGVTADKDWVERYCAIHEDCRMEKYEAGAGLAMSPRELMIPLNTEVIVKWDIATESAYIWDHSRTTHKPTDWMVDEYSLLYEGSEGSICLKKIFFGKLVTDIDRNCELICMSTKDLFESTLAEKRALWKKHRMDQARDHLNGVPIEARIYHHGVGIPANSGRYPWVKFEGFLGCERRLEPEIKQIVKEETGIDFEINDDISKKLGKLRKFLYNEGYEYDGLRIRDKKLKFVFSKHVASKDLDHEVSFDYNDLLRCDDIVHSI
jgi:hypothetical protein